MLKNCVVRTTFGALLMGLIAAFIPVRAPAIAQNSAGPLTVTFSITDFIVYDLIQDTPFDDGTDELELIYLIQEQGNDTNRDYRIKSLPSTAYGTHLTATSFEALTISIPADGRLLVSFALTETQDNITFRNPSDVTYSAEDLLAGVRTTVVFQFDRLNHARDELTYELSAAQEPTPCWPETTLRGDAGEVFFTSECDGMESIYAMPLAGSPVQHIVAGQSYSAVWAPDGTRFGYSAVVNNTWQIFINENGLLRQITADQSMNFVRDWSPDGTRILYLSKNEIWDVFVMDADGSNITQITANAEQESTARWSPDGKRIVIGVVSESGTHLYLIDPDGSNYTLLTNDGYAPVWSPDGSQILYSTESNGMQLIDVASRSTRPFGGGVIGSPGDWSAANAQILYTAPDGDDTDLFVINADGTNIRQLTANAVDEFAPRWKPAPGTAPLAHENDIQLGTVTITDTTLQQVLALDTVPLRNCSGTSELELAHTFSQSVERGLSVEIGASLAVSVSGSVWEVVEAEAEAQIEAKLGASIGETIEESFTITMRAAPGSTVTYEVEWILVSKTGTIEVIIDGVVYPVEFTVADQLQVNIHEPTRTPCQ